MLLSTRYAGRVAIIQLQGRLTLSPALSRLKPRVDSALSARSSTGLVLNLAVSDVDTPGLGELMAIHASAMRRGVRVALVEVNARIKQMLAIMRLDGIFADETSALQHIAQPEPPDQS